MWTLGAVIVLFSTAERQAWNPLTDTAGPITLRVGEIGVLEELEKPVPLEVSIAESAESRLPGR